ncbi:MAG: FtsX-like permease family protein [Clostridia bacterium]|nr:FtsX-like permease family protein [Clostridia bacterium]
MKKRKLTFNSIALGNLKHRKKRYVLMILGIVLSMVFSSSIIYFAFSAYTTSQEQTKADKGLYDIMCSDYEERVFGNMQQSDSFETIGMGYVVGFAFTDSEDRLSGTSVAKLDKISKELVNPILLSGAYPEKKGEIAIEQTTLLQLGITAKPGDKITLKFQTQNDDELMPEVKEKTYVLSGILRDKRSNIAISFDDKANIPSAFVSEYEQVDLGGKENIICYAQVTDKGYNEVWGLFSDEPELSSSIVFTYNEGLALNVDESLSFVYILVVAVILLLASSMGIINAFTTNLKERKKQIGLYRAVGATKKQIVTLFLREAILLGVVCVPVSLLISYFGVRVIVNNIFDEAFFEPNIWVLLVCGAFSLLCVVLASLIPIFAASRVTPMQAIRNIETARKLKNKKICPQKQFTVHKLLAKRDLTISKRKQVFVSIFLVITIVASSYIMSVFTYSIGDIYKEDYDYCLSLSSWTGGYAVNYPSSNNGFTENHKQTVLLNENIRSAYGYKNAKINMLVSDFDSLSNYKFIAGLEYSKVPETSELSDINEDNYRSLIKYDRPPEYTDIKNAAEYKGEFLDTEIIALDDEFIEELNRYVYDGKIDINKLNSGEQVIVYAPKEMYLVRRTNEYGSSLNTYDNKENIQYAVDRGEQVEIIASEKSDYEAGQKLDLSLIYAETNNTNFDVNGEPLVTKEDVDVTNKQVEIGAVIDFMDETAIPKYSDWGIVTTVQGMEHFSPRAKYKEIYFDLKAECTEETDEEVKAILKSVADCVDDGHYQSNYEIQIEQKETIKNSILLVCSIMILFYTISGSIINNTLSSNIKEDKRKIGTLRAVGANKKEITLSYILQLFSMFKWGFGIGFGLFGISYLILSLMPMPDIKALMSNMVFNPWVTLAFGVVLFAVCSLSVSLKIRKEMKNSIVENIREL